MYRRVEDYSFSLLQGNAVYRYLGENIVNEANNRACPIIYDESDGSRFFVKRLRYYYNKITSMDLQIHNHYLYILKNPPHSRFIIWPKDLVEMNQETRENATDYLVNNHQIFDNDETHDPSDYGLTFKCEDYEGLTKVSNIIAGFKKSRVESEGINYTNKRLMRIVYGMISRIKELNDAGYIFYDYDFSRFYVDWKDNVYLDFSNLIYHIDEQDKIRTGEIHLEEPREIPLDFMEPWMYLQDKNIQSKEKKHNQNTLQREEAPFADNQTQNYCLASMIFYLMIGKHAYDGNLVQAISDDSRESHYDLTVDRIQKPIFIFNPTDDSNSIGTMEAEEIYVERWNSLSEEIRDIFFRTLRRVNAERKVGSIFYSLEPSKWLSLFEKYGWHK